MNRNHLLSLTVFLLCAVLCAPAYAVSGSDDNLDEEIIISEMPSGAADTGTAAGDSGAGAAAAHQHGGAPTAGAVTGPAATWPAGAGWAGMLKLSPDQIAKFRSLRDRYLAETRDLRYDLAMRHLEAMRLYTDPKVAEAALMAKQRELSALRQKLADRRGQFTIQARGILTADQIRLIDNQVLKHLAWGFPGSGMGMRGGMGRGTMGQGMGMRGSMGGMTGGGRMGCP